VTDDPRERFVRALRRGLRCGPLKRRRVLREITAHLDDTVAELQASGMTEPASVQEALRRLGDAGAITSAFRKVRPGRSRSVRRLRSPAWVAVGAMSLVTAWAAELPQASGAKATTPISHSRHLGSRRLAGPRDHARPGDRAHRRHQARRR
jgi:DNA-binding transcriptional ArsR family regulator